MVNRVGGFRRKTRHKLSKPRQRKGKVSLSSYFQAFKEGDRVCLSAESAVQKGMYFPRFHGKAGVVSGKVGRCYKVLIKDTNKEKSLIIHPVHLKKLK